MQKWQAQHKFQGMRAGLMVMLGLSLSFEDLRVKMQTCTSSNGGLAQVSG